DATAHVGAVTVGGGSRVMLRNVVVEGESDYVSAGGNMLMNFYNAGDAGDVQANMIMRAFIGGHVEWLTARMLMNTQVNGGADAIGAWLFNQVSVSGTTEMLFATGGFEGNIWNGNLNGAANGMIINSYFEYVDDNNFDYDWDEDGIQDEYNILDDFVNPVRIINSYIGMYDEGNEE
ncbi:MAG: hypothetical protein JW709_09385, partial [Sedimentisphaerales bacterium]|nr:hypothetical protein [Sedimentisphaerales bacterium]